MKTLLEFDQIDYYTIKKKLILFMHIQYKIIITIFMYNKWMIIQIYILIISVQHWVGENIIGALRIAKYLWCYLIIHFSYIGIAILDYSPLLLVKLSLLIFIASFLV